MGNDRPALDGDLDLRTALEQPIFNRVIGKEVGRGDLDYEVYLQTGALLALQTRTSDLTVPDELLFQVMHQSQELWLKALAFEVPAVVDAMSHDRLHTACAVLDRIVVIQQSLGSELRILQTMTPDTFLAIRRNLGNGSGQESPGYNRLLLAASAADQAFASLLDRNGATLLDLYGSVPRSEQIDGIQRVAELLIDWDEAFQSWLVTHFHLVRRTIGVNRAIRALDGVPTQSLAPRMTRPLFPTLWDVRVELTSSWAREGGYAPGAPRGRGVDEVPTVAPPVQPRAADRSPARVAEPPPRPDAET